VLHPSNVGKHHLAAKQARPGLCGPPLIGLGIGKVLKKHPYGFKEVEHLSAD
jgi:hypothetical protein